MHAAFEDAAGPCILAVSGGRDSMFLLYLFRELRDAGLLSRPPLVFHLNHGLRPSAEEDLAFVAREARRLDFPFYFMERDAAVFARRTGTGIEVAGRRLRYRALGRLLQQQGGGLAITAHHADDYLESVLIHLIRGGGPAAMQTLAYYSRVEGVPVLRPMVALTRARITELVNEHGIPFLEDPTNASSEFLRNRLRRQVTPMLRAEGLDPLKLWRNFHEDPRVALPRSSPITRSAEYLSMDRRLLPDLRTGLAELKQLLDGAFRRLELAPADRKLLEELAEQMARGPAFRLSYVGRDFRIWSDQRGPVWIFRRDAAIFRPPLVRKIAASAAGDPAIDVTYNRRTRRYRLQPGQRVGTFRAGLRAQLGDGSHVPVRKLLREAGVPEPVREFLPLIVTGAPGEESPVVLCLSFWEVLRDRRFNRT